MPNAVSFAVLDYPSLLQFHVNAIWRLCLSTTPSERLKFATQRDQSLDELHRREDAARGVTA